MNMSHLSGKDSKSVVRAQVIRATALKLFVAEGFGSVSLRRIADMSGIQVGSLYNHIDGKQQLLFELIYEAEQNLFAALKQAVDGTLTPVAQVGAYVEQYFLHASRNKELHLLAVREKRCLDDGDATRLKTLLLSHERLIYQVLERGVKAGVFTIPSYEFAIKAVWSLLDGMLGGVSTNPADVSKCADQLKDCVTRLLGAGAAR
ncbi:TetR/AcrR family transcriptional regulator [Pseudomonas sp. NPDC089752]|uniref:TetR/AcrR family transcriptional regulator n=1 Tax=Pseudomonas sp. NPDC089752 TaxID=3364472 RepID=UPI00382886BA